MDMDSRLDSVAESAADRRRSGRNTRRPDHFAEENHEGSLLSNGSAKRKRTNHPGPVSKEGTDGESTEPSDEESEGEPDEEELRERRQQTRKNKPNSRPSAKKAKRNGASHTLAIRSADIQSRPAIKASKRQSAQARPSQLHLEGLYAELFGRGKAEDEVAADWQSSLNQNNVQAICHLVNLILQCVGCDSKIETHDIEDLDNVPSKLGDILDEFKLSQKADYPLVSKQKQYAGFRHVLTDFFTALVQSLHAHSTLYNEEAVFDNIHTWVATMAGAPLRPFRHTATIISLTMSTALCQIAGEIQATLALTRTQIETAKKQKSVNKGRVKTLEDTVKTSEERLATIDALLKDAFDSVFVHRYRDVDEKIRVECVSALGTWISTYRKFFLEGQYLRYLGWVLSDTNLQTRTEVIRQLKQLFKDRKNVAALRAFTERFRARIVEMGARDSDIGVRTETIELLDRLRNAELLEPDDIDTIGRLIFDTEPRVRRSVSRFFVSNIEDLYKASTEEFESEQFEVALPKAEGRDDYLRPSQTWIKFKCLGQTLTGYDGDGDSAEQAEKTNRILLAEDVHSRYMLATQAIFPHMKELHEWKVLAGYLLYDHSQITAESDDPDVALAVQGCYKLEAGEEKALLDVLYFAVKLHLQQIVESQSDRKGKKTQSSKDAVQEKQETTAQSLTVIIPQLLNKFGSTPQAAASILRLEQLLDIDLINDLSQSEATYSSLLDDINKQFLSHSDRKVLAEASKSLRQARTYEQSKETTDTKIQELWDDGIGSLQNLLKNQNLDTRGTLPLNVLREISNIVSRLSNLAGVSDCSGSIERRMPAAPKKQKGRSRDQTLLEVLLQLSNRGVPDEETTEQFSEVEDDLCSSVILILSLYLRWKVYNIKSAISSNMSKSPALSTGSLVNLALHRAAFIEVLTPIIVNRTPLDPIRITASVTALDLLTLFSTVRHMKPSKGAELPDDLLANLGSLVTMASEELQTAVMQTHEKLENNFARKSNRKLEKAEQKEIAVDDAPIDSDEEDDEEDGSIGEDEEIEAGAKGKDKRKEAALLAEQALCEMTSKIVLAMIGGVMEGGIKERLLLNRTKLGKSYGQVLGYLEEPKQKSRPTKQESKKVPSARGETKGKGTQKSEPMVLEEDDIEDEEIAGGGVDEEEVLREQGLADDEPENEDGGEEEARNGGAEDDEIMGD